MAADCPLHFLHLTFICCQVNVLAPVFVIVIVWFIYRPDILTDLDIGLVSDRGVVSIWWQDTVFLSISSCRVHFISAGFLENVLIRSEMVYRVWESLKHICSVCLINSVTLYFFHSYLLKIKMRSSTTIETVHGADEVAHTLKSII